MANATVTQSQSNIDNTDTINTATGAALEYLKPDDKGFYGNKFRDDVLRLIYKYDEYEVDTDGLSAVITAVLAHDELLRDVMLSRVEKALPIPEMWQNALDSEGRPKMDFRYRRDALAETVTDFLIRHELYYAVASSGYGFKQRVRSAIVFMVDYYQWARDAVRAAA